MRLGHSPCKRRCAFMKKAFFAGCNICKVASALRADLFVAMFPNPGKVIRALWPIGPVRYGTNTEIKSDCLLISKHSSRGLEVPEMRKLWRDKRFKSTHPMIQKHSISKLLLSTPLRIGSDERWNKPRLAVLSPIYPPIARYPAEGSLSCDTSSLSALLAAIGLTNSVRDDTRTPHSAIGGSSSWASK